MPLCPHDGAALQLAAVGARTFCHCRTCAGIWLPGVFVHGEIGPVPRPERALKSIRERNDRTCPDDGKALLAIIHYDVEIDLCPACSGVWLDVGEMAKIHRRRHRRLRGKRALQAAGDGLDAINLVDLTAHVVEALLSP